MNPHFEPAGRAIVAVLLNSLWEAAVLAFAVWLVLRVVKNLNAATRCVVLSCALAAAVVLPIVTTLPLVTTASAPAISAPVRAPSTQTAAARTASAPATYAAASHAVAQEPAARPQIGVRLPARLHLAFPTLLAAILLALWGLGVVVLLVPLIASLFALERLKHDALPLPVAYREAMQRWNAAQKGSRDVRICVLDEIEVPIAIGLFDSMILLPKRVLDTMPQSDVDQIALHELAHLRRADDYINGLQRIVKAVFFFNPTMLWLSHQLDLEREVACDDWVLSQTGDDRPYAFCLTKLAEMTAWPHRPLAAPGAFVTRKSISVRVERLLRAGRDVRTGISLTAAGAMTAALVAVFFVLQSVAPSIAFTVPALPQPAISPAR
ncbi:MAG: M56 family metallopeptidase, partial [Vulcanimicrobiaceae bacterium]